jgi:response regulator NasT
MSSSLSVAAAQTSAPTSRRVLVAEDHDGLREILVMLLKADGHHVVDVSNGLVLADAVAVSLDPELGSGRFDLVISDVRMPKMSGLSAFEQLDYAADLPPVVFISGFADEQVYRHAQQLHALAVFDKPLDFDELRAFVSNYFAGTARRSTVAQ